MLKATELLQYLIDRLEVQHFKLNKCNALVQELLEGEKLETDFQEGLDRNLNISLSSIKKKLNHEASYTSQPGPNHSFINSEAFKSEFVKI